MDGRTEDKTWYLRDLIGMVRSGVPIGQALAVMDLPFDPELLADGPEKKELARLLRQQDETRLSPEGRARR
jgi:hypothetical protein